MDFEKYIELLHEIFAEDVVDDRAIKLLLQAVAYNGYKAQLAINNLTANKLG